MPTAAPQLAPPQETNQDIKLPHNIEAEQQLLGAILNDNSQFDRISSLLQDDHFFDPLHQHIFAIIAARIKQGVLVTPVTLNAFIQDHAGFAELGGAAYLVRLSGSAVASFAVRDYAQIIYDLAIRRKLIQLGQDIVYKAAFFDVASDAVAQITDAEKSLYDLAQKGNTDSGFQVFLNVAASAIDLANVAYKRDRGIAGLATGLVDLDKKLGGLHKSDLLILAGRPAMGKTALATNIAFNVAKSYERGVFPDGTEGNIRGGIVGFYSLEMSSEQLATRILSQEANIPSYQVRGGNMNPDEFRHFIETAKELEECPLYIDDTPALPIAQLAARARRLKRTKGLDLLIIDYLQLVRPTSNRDNRVNEISEITQGLKAIAKDLDIPVIALSQLSRQVEMREDKRPHLADLRESGSIEQDADVVMFVFREEYYQEREKPDDDDIDKMEKWKAKMEKCHGKAEIIIGKQRHGPIGQIDLSFQANLTRFGDLALDDNAWQNYTP